jgi:hypothetical protein
MFITNPNDESIDPEDDDSSGRKLWQRFRQVLEWPSFHVSIACGGKVEFIQTSEISDWIKLPRFRCNDPWLVEPRLISPGWLNGSGGWKMEVLREVWEGNEPARPVSVLVFVTEDGGRYVDSELRTAAAMLTDLRKIYPS